MYPEFIAIFIGLGVLAVLQIVTIVFVLLMGRKIRRQNSGRAVVAHRESYSEESKTNSNGIAFCTNCGAQFSANIMVCPMCGKPRS